MKKSNTSILISICVILFFSTCKDDVPLDQKTENQKDSVSIQKKPAKSEIRKVTFYLENSASMFGYVHGSTDYTNVLSELAYKNQFIKEKTPREFNFINGGTDLKITHIGNDPINLTNKLNKDGFNCGDVTKSNLNEMFQVALNNAKGDSISILISDGIYDVNSSSPITAIETLGQATKAKFIERLSDEDTQTIMIKLNSDFNGDYYYISKKGKTKINQNRPYYIWIFGESRLLNKYFPEDYLSKLNGYEAMVRFLKIGESEIPYRATTYNLKGSFDYNQDDKNILEEVDSDSMTNEFKFSIAVDYSSLPYSDIYLTSISNYDINGNFKILRIEPYDKIGKKIYGLNFEPTHVITVHTKKSPYGELKLSLKNTVPDWISQTDIDNDTDILNNTSKTIGFSHLTKGIANSYQSFKTDKGNITKFKIDINN